MGYYKQLHVDCENGECSAGDYETCYKQHDNVSYVEDKSN